MLNHLYIGIDFCYYTFAEIDEAIS